VSWRVGLVHSGLPQCTRPSPITDHRSPITDHRSEKYFLPPKTMLVTPSPEAGWRLALDRVYARSVGLVHSGLLQCTRPSLITDHRSPITDQKNIFLPPENSMGTPSSEGRCESAWIFTFKNTMFMGQVRKMSAVTNSLILHLHSCEFRTMLSAASAMRTRSSDANRLADDESAACSRTPPPRPPPASWAS
jgi:hypothetical protein